MCNSFLAFKIPPLSKGNRTVYQQNGCQTERSTKLPIKKQQNLKYYIKSETQGNRFQNCPPTPPLTHVSHQHVTLKQKHGLRVGCGGWAASQKRKLIQH